MTSRTDLDDLVSTLHARRSELQTFRDHWRGCAPAAYLSADARKALDNRLARLGANFPRLVITSMVDRLQIVGFDRDRKDDQGLWQLWQLLDLDSLADRVHVGRLLYGFAAVTVWGSEAGARPSVSADSAWNVVVDTDPATGEVVRACRLWTRKSSPTDAGQSVALLFTPDRVTRWQADMAEAPANSGAWKATLDVDNPYDAVPVVPFYRRLAIDDEHGTSAVADVLDLADAHSKVLGDAMVTSEFYARPRRWATGLELIEDEDGNPVDPFADSRFLQNEDPAGKFGQLDPVGVDGYADLLASLSQQIGALTGLPPHYLGLHGDQPANADSVRAAEAQLTSRARTEIRQLDRPWATVAGLMLSNLSGTPVDAGTITPRWASPEIRTPGQAADAAVKLRSIGVPLGTVLADTLGYTSEQVDAILAAVQAEAPATSPAPDAPAN